MKYLDLTFPNGAENLACDEALLEQCENGSAESMLRVWEPQNLFVVLGYANRVRSELNLAACERAGIPILRRFSGGGSVLQGPGCVNYTLIINNAQSPALGHIISSYEFVLRRHQRFLSELTGMAVEVHGTSDLAISGRKVSGNAQHRKREFTLLHGTFLLSLDLSLMEQLLPLPTKQPAYRKSRPHSEFVTNLRVDSEAVKRGLRETWSAEAEFDWVPYDTIRRLVAERYGCRDWIYKF